MSIDKFIYLDDYGNECCEVESLREYLKDKAIVPVEPIYEQFSEFNKMIAQLDTYDSGGLRCSADDFAHIYKAMLSAAEGEE